MGRTHKGPPLRRAHRKPSVKLTGGRYANVSIQPMKPARGAVQRRMVTKPIPSDGLR